MTDMTAGGDILGLRLRRFGHGGSRGFFHFHWFGFHSWRGGTLTIIILLVVLAAVVVGVRAMRRR